MTQKPALLSWTLWTPWPWVSSHSKTPRNLILYYTFFQSNVSTGRNTFWTRTQLHRMFLQSDGSSSMVIIGSCRDKQKLRFWSLDRGILYKKKNQSVALVQGLSQRTVWYKGKASFYFLALESECCSLGSKISSWPLDSTTITTVVYCRQQKLVSHRKSRLNACFRNLLNSLCFSDPELLINILRLYT